MPCHKILYYFPGHFIPDPSKYGLPNNTTPEDIVRAQAKKKTRFRKTGSKKSFSPAEDLGKMIMAQKAIASLDPDAVKLAYEKARQKSERDLNSKNYMLMARRYKTRQLSFREG